jgi:hypothetical protein
VEVSARFQRVTDEDAVGLSAGRGGYLTQKQRLADFEK